MTQNVVSANFKRDLQKIIHIFFTSQFNATIDLGLKIMTKPDLTHWVGLISWTRLHFKITVFRYFETCHGYYSSCHVM